MTGDLHPMIALPYGDHSTGIEVAPPSDYHGRHRTEGVVDTDPGRYSRGVTAGPARHDDDRRRSP